MIKKFAHVFYGPPVLAASLTLGFWLCCGLTATVALAAADEKFKALPEGFLAGPALVNQGGNLLAGRGLAEAMAAAGKEGPAANRGVFGAMSFGRSSYETDAKVDDAGSKLDMDGLSLLTGLAYGLDSDLGLLTVGSFLEFGRGSYDTRNNFDKAPSVSGEGGVRHWGGGILGRLDFADTGPGRFYAESSFRGGALHQDYRSGNLPGLEYESDSNYYGLYLGPGYVTKFENFSFDFYGKYFWTRVDGDSATLSTGESVNFGGVTSSRLRPGGRLGYDMSESLTPYIGAAYELELAGHSHATIYGEDIDSPTLRGVTGVTGVWELGLNFKPSPARPLSLDLGLEGSVGQKEGVAGSLQVKWEF